MSLSPGQQSALAQLRAFEAARPGAVEILEVHPPEADGGVLIVEVSLDCRGVEQSAGGVGLRDRERFRIKIKPGFPFGPPSVYSMHTRWSGRPHVQWGNYLCLYLAPATEWVPSDGLFGLIERLWTWLGKAATDQLDPAAGAIHPPVAYAAAGTPMVIPHENAPEVGSEPWVGWVTTHRPTGWRVDLRGWRAITDETGDVALPERDDALAILLPSAFDWEYPRTVYDLIQVLADRGVSFDRLLLLLGLVSLRASAGEHAYVVIGTAMRGQADDRALQHLVGWQIPVEAVEHLNHALGLRLDTPDLEGQAKAAQAKAIEWAATADARWCSVREARPEIAIRRDERSPLGWFAGKTVAIWGCGALGAPIAEWLARGEVRRLVIYDTALVSPGILVRQPFTDADIGRTKVHALQDRLEAIRPGVVVEAHFEDILAQLDEEDWHDGADVVIDASASIPVASMLEATRRSTSGPRPVIISALVGHNAQRALLVVAKADHGGAGWDVVRRAKLECLRRDELHAYADEFWPDPPRSELFQPEPGCSDVTFRGSGAEIGALVGTMLTEAARGLRDGEESAIAHLVTLAGAEHSGPRQVRLAFLGPVVVEDASGFEVRVSQPAAREISAWIERSRRNVGPASETGGIVFGERDDATRVIWVDEVSGPPPDSVASPAEFVCGTAGVRGLTDEKAQRSRKSLGFLGMWHTHPHQGSDFSARDLRGMAELLDAATSQIAQALVLIVGQAATAPELASYVVDRSRLDDDVHVMAISCGDPAPLRDLSHPRREIGLALSGGGSRAIAFHLGCLRALHDRGVLDAVKVISGVSGGSLMTALWAYSDDDFETFDARVQELLRRGLQGRILTRALLSRRLPQALATRSVAGTAALLARGGSVVASAAARILRRERRPTISPPLRRWVSLTDSFEDVVRARICGEKSIAAPRRDDVGVVFNSCDLSTGSAFRFGSRHSGVWRYGEIPGNDLGLATAVAASAAYPVILPALDRKWELEKKGQRVTQRLILTDGGVFDNLGTSCLHPNRDPAYSYNVYPVDYIVACDAGRGLLDPTVPYGWASRMIRSFGSTYRKVQDAERGELHNFVSAGALKGFVMPYLGQQDSALPVIPPDLVRREMVADYPTNFAPMSADALDVLTKRGEQLARILIERWAPEL